MFVLDENHFRKCFSENEAVWLVRKILFSGNWNMLTEKKSLWPWKSFYTSIFPSKYFRKMRERERQSARARSRSHRISWPDRDSDRTESKARSHRMEITVDAISQRSRSRFREIAPDQDRRRRFARLRRRSRSHEEGEIAIAPSIAIDGAIWVVACVFLNLCFPSSFPNTRKYFPENFLKCNQTPWKHFPFPEISISGKYVFSGKRFTATKHNLNSKNKNQNINLF